MVAAFYGSGETFIFCLSRCVSARSARALEGLARGAATPTLALCLSSTCISREAESTTPPRQTLACDQNVSRTISNPQLGQNPAPVQACPYLVARSPLLDTTVQLSRAAALHCRPRLSFPHRLLPLGQDPGRYFREYSPPQDGAAGRAREASLVAIALQGKVRRAALERPCDALT